MTDNELKDFLKNQDIEDLFKPLEDLEEIILFENERKFNLKFFFKYKSICLGILFILIIVGLSIFVPIFSKYSYNEQNSIIRNLSPSFAHLFGTDKFGRDIFVRVWEGTRISLLISFISSFICLIMGVLYGSISGYAGKKIDILMMSLADIIYSIPSMIYIILIMLVFGSNVISMIIGICISEWIVIARIVRSSTLILKKKDFVTASIIMGASSFRIIFKDIIMNMSATIIVNFIFLVPHIIFIEAFLSFLGIGISAPLASLGTLVRDASTQIELYPMQAVYPIVVIIILILSLNSIGNGLEKIFDYKI